MFRFIQQPHIKGVVTDFHMKVDNVQNVIFFLLLLSNCQIIMFTLGLNFPQTEMFIFEKDNLFSSLELLVCFPFFP